MTPSQVALFSTNVMRQLLQAEGMKLAEELSRRLYEYQERMADVALKKVSARLASLLLRLLESEGVVNGQGVGISTRFTHDQLAAMVGSKRVAVSRAMGELRRVDALEVKGRRVYLKDKAAL